MPTLTPAHLGYLRDDHPHKIAARLSVIVPPQVYCGVITGTPARGAIDITVIDQSGNIANIVEGQTVYVGTSCGAKDIGKRRVRLVAGQVITLDESPLIWEDGWYLTVVEYWELWSIFPYISGTAGNYTFYKDRDVVYTDQNNQPPPVATAGWHQAGMLTGATIEFDLIALSSYAVTPGATISSYLWECGSGVIDNAAVASTTITFTAAGTYWVKLTVTDSNGKTQLTRRVIRVHDASDPPYYDFELQSALSGSWSRGGWETRFTVHGDAAQDDFPDGALVLLWADQYYDTVQINIQYSMMLVGYLEGESIVKEVDTGSVSFDVSTIHKRMDNCNMYSVSISAVDGVPATWNEYRNELTVARAAHHYWKYHSTLFEIADVILPMYNTLEMSAQDFEDGTLYTTVDTFAMQHGIFAHVCCDKFGRVYLEQDIQLLSDAERAAKDVVMDITEEDRVGTTDVEMLRNSQLRCSIAEISGVDAAGDPFLAQAPGDVPEPFGKDVVGFSRLVLDDQDHANFLAGRVYGVANQELIEIRIPLAGNYTFMDIALQEWYTMTLAASSNKRGIALAAANMVLRDISVNLDISNGVVEQEVVFEPEADAYIGVKVDPPVYDTPDYPDPPLPYFPPWVPFPPPDYPDAYIYRNSYAWYRTTSTGISFIASKAVINDASAISGSVSADLPDNMLLSTDQVTFSISATAVYRRLIGSGVTETEAVADLDVRMPFTAIDNDRVAVITEDAGTYSIRVVDFSTSVTTLVDTLPTPTVFDILPYYLLSVNVDGQCKLVYSYITNYNDLSKSVITIRSINVDGTNKRTKTFTITDSANDLDPEISRAQLQSGTPVVMDKTVVGFYPMHYSNGSVDTKSYILAYNVQTNTLYSTYINGGGLSIEPYFAFPVPDYQTNSVYFMTLEYSDSNYYAVCKLTLGTMGITVKELRNYTDEWVFVNGRKHAYMVRATGEVVKLSTMTVVATGIPIVADTYVKGTKVGICNQVCDVDEKLYFVSGNNLVGRSLDGTNYDRTIAIGMSPSYIYLEGAKFLTPGYIIV